MLFDIAIIVVCVVDVAATVYYVRKLLASNRELTEALDANTYENATLMRALKTRTPNGTVRIVK